MVERRAFRADLFYRLNVLPDPAYRRCATARGHSAPGRPLRPPIRRASGKMVEHVPDEVIAMLKQCRGPGTFASFRTSSSVRSLPPPSNVATASAGAPCRADGPGPADAGAGRAGSHRGDLQATNGVLGGWDGAAARLGLCRTTLISKMQRLGISAVRGLRKSTTLPAVSRVVACAAGLPSSLADLPTRRPA